MTIEEKKRRAEGVRRLCKVLNVGQGYICDAFLTLGCGEPSCKVLNVGQGYICDAFLTLGCGEPSVDPFKLERLLKSRSVYREDEESIRECLERVYGKEIADLAESLL